MKISTVTCLLSAWLHIYWPTRQRRLSWCACRFCAKVSDVCCVLNKNWSLCTHPNPRSFIQIKSEPRFSLLSCGFTMMDSSAQRAGQQMQGGAHSKTCLTQEISPPIGQENKCTNRECSLQNMSDTRDSAARWAGKQMRSWYAIGHQPNLWSRDWVQLDSKIEYDEYTHTDISGIQRRSSQNSNDTANASLNLWTFVSIVNMLTCGRHRFVIGICSV